MKIELPVGSGLSIKNEKTSDSYIDMYRMLHGVVGMIDEILEHPVGMPVDLLMHRRLQFTQQK